MKKQITLSILVMLMPFMLMAQTATANPFYENLVVILLVLAFAAGLFFAFRYVMIWYFKIDVIIKNQEVQTRVLKAIYRSLEESASNTKDLLDEMKKDKI